MGADNEEDRGKPSIVVETHRNAVFGNTSEFLLSAFICVICGENLLSSRHSWLSPIHQFTYHLPISDLSHLARIDISSRFLSRCIAE